jgi:hypothetical protein
MGHTSHNLRIVLIDYIAYVSGYLYLYLTVTSNFRTGRFVYVHKYFSQVVQFIRMTTS